MAIRDRSFNPPVTGTRAIRELRSRGGSGIPCRNCNTLICTDADPGILMISPREKTIILLVASLASFLVPYTGSSITVALPAMAAQFHVDAVTLGWITSAYIISAAVFIVPFGRLADIRGRKKIFILGVGIFILASLACALAPDEGLLIAARFCQGIGGAMLFATSVAIVTQVYGPGERGWALGITIATVYAGSPSARSLAASSRIILAGRPSFSSMSRSGSQQSCNPGICPARMGGCEGEQFDLHGSVIYGINALLRDLRSAAAAGPYRCYLDMCRDHCRGTLCLVAEAMHAPYS